MSPNGKLVVNSIVVVVALGGLAGAFAIIAKDLLARVVERQSIEEPDTTGEWDPRTVPPLVQFDPNHMGTSSDDAASVSFREVPSPQATLVGLEVDTCTEGDTTRIERLRGIFRTPDGTTVSAPVGRESNGGDVQATSGDLETLHLEAKEGFALLAIEIYMDKHIDGMRVYFARQYDDGLEIQDRYPTQWIGFNDPNRGPRRIGDGRTIVGFEGSWCDGFESLGLVAVGRGRGGYSPYDYRR
jgi:hypothetical protein